MLEISTCKQSHMKLDKTLQNEEVLVWIMDYFHIKCECFGQWYGLKKTVWECDL